MVTTEWSPEEQNIVSLPTLVSSSDLFEGELFGEELMDIYNSTVNDDGNVADIALLDPPSVKGKDDDHPGADVAAAVAAIDDGLGAFRPSTSFNDLSALMPPAEDTANDATAVAPTTQVEEEESQKKRSTPAEGTEAPLAKRTRRQSGSKMQDSVTAPEILSTVSEVLPESSVVTPRSSSGDSITSLPEPPEIIQPAPVTSDPAATAAAVAAAVLEAPVPDENMEEMEGDMAESTAASANHTEADFKSIAQVAVSNLIMSAGNQRTPEDKSKVDTSTAHIKALTGNNWVAACANAVSSVPVATAPAANADKGNNRVRRQNLTPDERARQNRDRNREHARNTRLRKKAYVEELKRTLTELVAQRDAADLEKRQSAQRELEQREVRFRVLEEFLKLRGRNELSKTRWVAILEDGFWLKVPLAPFYKSAEGSEVAGFDQKLSTIDSIMMDSTGFSSFLQTLRIENETMVTLQPNCDRKSFFMDGCNAVLEWTATAVGSKQEFIMKGIIRGKFSPASNKLLFASISYDTGSILAQVHPPPKEEVEKLESTDDVAAAAAEAAQADAILHSLEMPRLNALVPSDVAVVPPSSGSSASESSDKGESSDESVDQENSENGGVAMGMTTRRVQRRD